METKRIGNDIRLRFRLRLGGQVSLETLAFRVEVRPSKPIAHNHDHSYDMCDCRDGLPMMEVETVFMHGVVMTVPRRVPVMPPQQPCSPQCDEEDLGMALPCTIVEKDGEHFLEAVWRGNRQFKTGVYDIIATVCRNGVDSGIADAYRILRLVSHSIQADPTDCNCGCGVIGVESVINLRLSIDSGTDAPETIAVTGVSLSQPAVSLAVGATRQLTATVSPDNATDKTLTWASSNPSVATVSPDGLVTAVSAGNATITASSNADGTKTGSCAVTVTNPVRYYHGNNADGELSALPQGASDTASKTFSITGNGVNKTLYFAVPAGASVSVTVAGFPADFDKAADSIQIDGRAYDLYYSSATTPWTPDDVASVTINN